ncbi:MAG: SH3 domain-containing protein [bacterium]
MIWLLVLAPILLNQESSAGRLSDYYNQGVNYYNQSQYGPAAGYFYYVYLRNPYDSKVTESLRTTLLKLDQPLKEDHRVYLQPVKNLLLWLHLILLVASLIFASVYIMKSRRVFVITFILLMFLSVTAVLEYWQVSKYYSMPKAMVTEDNFMHSQPAQGARTDMHVDAGVVVKVEEIRGEWIKIEISGQQGWMVKSNLMLL